MSSCCDLRNETAFPRRQEPRSADPRRTSTDCRPLYHYEPLNRLLPVERFMRDYFEHTGDIRYISSSFIDSVRARSAMWRPRPARCSAIAWKDDFRVGPVHISATRKGLDKVRSDLAEVLRLMDLANMYQKRIDHRTWEAIRTAMAQRPVQEISDEAVASVPVAAESTWAPWATCCDDCINYGCWSRSFRPCSMPDT